ncbi:MAG: DUF1080 domain-containing protein [Nevskiaceae bacterium]|jgi:hypothetical protein|nr:DUF1080 domain-containing protein [Nevskiaceae bacterium]
MKDCRISKALVPALLFSAVLAGCSGQQAPPQAAAAPAETAATSSAVNMSGSFDGWRQLGSANWTIENGEFVATMGTGMLVTQDTYTDFRITLEFFVDSGKANSGVFLRASNPDEIAETNAYEVNIFDERPDQTGRTGAIVRFAPASQAINAAGQWNTYDITAQGDHLVVVFNGVTTVDTHDSTYASGPIALQYGAGEVRFRNVKIERL